MTSFNYGRRGFLRACLTVLNKTNSKWQREGERIIHNATDLKLQTESKNVVMSLMEYGIPS